MFCRLQQLRMQESNLFKQHSWKHKGTEDDLLSYFLKSKNLDTYFQRNTVMNKFEVQKRISLIGRKIIKYRINYFKMARCARTKECGLSLFQVLGVFLVLSAVLNLSLVRCDVTEKENGSEKEKAGKSWGTQVWNLGKT